MYTCQVAHTQGTLNLVFKVVNNPRHWSLCGPFRLTIFYLFVIDVEHNIQRFSFGGIIIDLFLHKAVNVFVINSYLEVVLRLGFVVDPHFLKGIQATYRNSKREKRISILAFLLGADYMLTNLKLCKLCLHVKKHRCANILTLAQEAKLDTFLRSIHLH